MAKKNKKKENSAGPTGPTTPKVYIKQKGRSLGINRCLINDDWRDSHIANIFVVRQMPSGNYVVGVYMLDLYCLGLKDTFFVFNITPEKFEEKYIIPYSHIELEECDYELVHNIIYGGIDFAADAGIQPHKDFAITSGLLEADNGIDTEEEIEFGHDGIHHFIPGPHDNVYLIQKTLDRVLGKGNYLSTMPLNDWDDDLEDEDLVDPPLTEEERYIIDIVNGRFILEGKKILLEEEIPVISTILESLPPYPDLVPDVELFDFYPIGIPMRTRLQEKTKEILERNPQVELSEAYIIGLEDMTENEFPENPDLHIYLYQRYVFHKDEREISEAPKYLEEIFEKFPDQSLIRIELAMIHLEHCEYDLAFQLMNDKWTWEERMVGKQFITIDEVIKFNLVRIVKLWKEGQKETAASIYWQLARKYDDYDEIEDFRIYFGSNAFADNEYVSDYRKRIGDLDQELFDNFISTLAELRRVTREMRETQLKIEEHKREIYNAENKE